MGFIKTNGNGLKGVSLRDPREIFQDLLKSASGANLERTVRFNIFYQIIAFKGAKEGVGCSTLVANTALALANLGINVCVVDTSILCPCQDILLKTNYDKVEKKNVVDWFDMGMVRQSVLNISSINKRVSVLSFQNRNIIDMLSTSDNSSLVELAFTQLSTKFDIILVDICHEPTNISASCMQLSQKLIQVWGSSEIHIRGIEKFIENNLILSCSMDKMRYVVTNMVLPDLNTDWDSILNKYHFKRLSTASMSMEIATMQAAGQTLYGAASRSPAVQEFNDCITDIACHLLGINGESDSVSKYDTSKVTKNEDVTLKQTKKEDYAEVSNDYMDTEVSQEEEYMDAYAESNSTDAFEEPKPRGFFRRR